VVDKQLLHPDLLTSLWRFYPSSCTIQQATVDLNSFGEEVLTFEDLAGHVDIPCAVSPLSGGEVRGVELISEISGFRVALEGYFPSIVPKMRAVIDGGVVFDIRHAEADSHHRTTYLTCEVVA